LNISQSCYLCPFKGIISHDGKKFVIVPAWWEKFEKIPTWRGKVDIILMLIYPSGRKLWWLMCLTVLFYCVIVIKHSMSLEDQKSTQDKNDMQAWLVKVLMIKDFVEFLKWTEKKVLPYELRNNFILHDVIMWMK
jgi:hypothetical protein